MTIDTATERGASLLNTLAAAWILLLAFVILADVLGRALFGSPLQGTKEIISNSVVAIVFLQFPFAVLERKMLRATVVYDHVGEIGRRVVDVVAYALGILFFVAIGIGGIEDLIIGWRIGEYEGEGALRVPVYPVRAVVVGFAFVTAAVYLLLLVRTAAGRERVDHDRDLDDLSEAA